MEYCRLWYNENYRSSGINPFTGRNIKINGSTWKKVDKYCSYYNTTMRRQQPRQRHSSYTPEESLINDIKDVVLDNWNNEKLESICGFGPRTDTIFDENDIMSDQIEGLIKNPVEDIPGYGDRDEKKYMSSASTDFNTLYMFHTSNERLQFIALVMKVYRAFLDEIYRASDITKDTMDIILKGGLIFRILLHDLVRDFDSETEDFIVSQIEESTKISDYDFEIVSNKTIINSGLFNKINILSYIVLLRLLKYLEENKTDLFSFYKRNRENQSILLEKLRQNMQVLCDNAERGSTYKGCKIVRVLTDQVTQEELLEYKDKSRTTKIYKSNLAFIKRFDNGNTDLEYAKHASHMLFIGYRDLIETYNIQVDWDLQDALPSNFYATHNPQIYIDIEGTDFTLDFNLNRIKLVYTVLYEKKINGVITKLRDTIPGEILDLSHSGYNDIKVTHTKVRFSRNPYYHTYQLRNYKLSFMSYSYIGLLDDIEYILFGQTNGMPWIAKKYMKRIIRYIYLYIFMYFSDLVALSLRVKVNHLNRIIKYLSGSSRAVLKTDKFLEQLAINLKVKADVDVADDSDRDSYDFIEIVNHHLKLLHHIFDNQKADFYLSLGDINESIFNIADRYNYS